MQRVLANLLFGPVIDSALLFPFHGNAEHASFHTVFHTGNRQQPVGQSECHHVLVEGYQTLLFTTRRFRRDGREEPGNPSFVVTPYSFLVIDDGVSEAIRLRDSAIGTKKERAILGRQAEAQAAPDLSELLETHGLGRVTKLDAV